MRAFSLVVAWRVQYPAWTVNSFLIQRALRLSATGLDLCRSVEQQKTDISVEPKAFPTAVKRIILMVLEIQ
jgi:hypothetical protein